MARCTAIPRVPASRAAARPASELDWELGAGPAYLRRIDDGKVWRADITITAPPGHARRGEHAMAVSRVRP